MDLVFLVVTFQVASKFASSLAGITVTKDQISSFDKTKIELIQQFAAGKQKAAVEGPGVFEYLKNTVLKKNV